MSELMDQALKEGITTDNVDAEKDTPSVSTQQTTEKTQPTETVKDTTSVQKSTENVPFDQHPRFKALYKQNKDFERKLADYDRRYQETLEKLNQTLAQRNTPQTPLTQEALQEEQALAMLRQKLGLDKFDQTSQRAESLEQELESLRNERTTSEFNSEFDQMLDIATKAGLDKEEVAQEMADYIDSHPVLSQMSYAKGAVMMAFRDKYWDRMGELKEREQNLKLIQERDKKKAANSEQSSTTSTGGKNLPSSMKEHLEDLIRDGGGQVSI